jgi:hypothetical protein
MSLSISRMLGASKHFLVILLGEVCSKLMDPCEMQLSTLDHAKNAGKTCGRAATSDALHGNGFRHVKALRAESAFCFLGALRRFVGLGWAWMVRRSI